MPLLHHKEKEILKKLFYRLLQKHKPLSVESPERLSRWRCKWRWMSLASARKQQRTFSSGSWRSDIDGLYVMIASFLSLASQCPLRSEDKLERTLKVLVKEIFVVCMHLVSLHLSQNAITSNHYLLSLPFNKRKTRHFVCPPPPSTHFLTSLYEVSKCGGGGDIQFV